MTSLSQGGRDRSARRADTGGPVVRLSLALQQES